MLFAACKKGASLLQLLHLTCNLSVENKKNGCLLVLLTHTCHVSIQFAKTCKLKSSSSKMHIVTRQ